MIQQEERFADTEAEELFEDEEDSRSAGSRDGKATGDRAALRDFSEEEQRLILRTVWRFWRRWAGAFTAASEEDMLGEAVLAIHGVCARAAILGKAAGAGLIALAIYRRLLKRVADDYRQCLQHAARDQVEFDAERLQVLEAESEAEWSALAGETLREIVGDERVVAALLALKPLEGRIVDLWFIEGLTHAAIAARLNESPERLPQERKLTARAVENRFERAIRRLRELLGAEAVG